MNDEKKYTEQDLNNARYKCIWCGKKITITKNSTAYVSHSKNSFGADEKGNGKMIWCKDCVNKQYGEYWHQYNGDLRKAIFMTCRKFDIPFTDHKFAIMSTAVLKDDYGSDKAIGTYISKLFTIQTDENLKCFDDGLTDINIINYQNGEVEQSDEELFGYGYSPELYFAFRKKWNKLINSYGIKTSIHDENLITYVRHRVKEEMATAKGDVGEAAKWGALADKAAVAARLNVNQLSKSDITGGIELVPQIFEAVESEVGVIPILPHLKEQPYDDVDLIIWCILNYGRRLEGKSRIDYKDIWYFYDEMLNEFFEQKGFSKEDIQKEKEKRNNVFRDLGEIYKEPVYEESDS